jgi:hypothetical protein
MNPVLYISTWSTEIERNNVVSLDSMIGLLIWILDETLNCYDFSFVRACVSGVFTWQMIFHLLESSVSFFSGGVFTYFFLVIKLKDVTSVICMTSTAGCVAWDINCLKA